MRVLTVRHCAVEPRYGILTFSIVFPSNFESGAAGIMASRLFVEDTGKRPRQTWVKSVPHAMDVLHSRLPQWSVMPFWMKLWEAEAASLQIKCSPHGSTDNGKRGTSCFVLLALIALTRQMIRKPAVDGEVDGAFSQ